MRFDLVDLRLFLSVHEAGTITGGAQAVHMTLASASERIRGMEDESGAALLLRTAKGVQLTAAGRTLLLHAGLVLRQVDGLKDALAGYGGGLRGHIRLLCNTSALSVHLPEVVSRFLASRPGISIDLEERPSHEIVDALRHDVGDIGIVSNAADLDGLQSFPFRADPLALVVPRDHRLAKRVTVGFADIVDHPFVGLVQGSALQEHLAQHARRLGKRLNYRIRLGSFESVCRVVGEGIGVGIVPQAVAVRHARSARIKRLALTDDWAARHLVLCVRRLETLPAPAQQLVHHVLDPKAHRQA
jgi:DNA-binding transcriptional LysR family regulator